MADRRILSHELDARQQDGDSVQCAWTAAGDAVCVVMRSSVERLIRECGGGPAMSYANAPLTAIGRLRLISRVEAGRPTAHVAVEAGIACQTLSKWVGLYRREGQSGLLDRRSAPRRSPRRTSPQVVARIEHLRREQKYSARLITHTLAAETTVSQATVSTWLVDLHIN